MAGCGPVVLTPDLSSLDWRVPQDILHFVRDCLLFKNVFLEQYILVIKEQKIQISERGCN